MAFTKIDNFDGLHQCRSVQIRIDRLDEFATEVRNFTGQQWLGEHTQLEQASETGSRRQSDQYAFCIQCCEVTFRCFESFCRCSPFPCVMCNRVKCTHVDMECIAAFGFWMR